VDLRVCGEGHREVAFRGVTCPMCSEKARADMLARASRRSTHAIGATVPPAVLMDAAIPASARLVFGYLYAKDSCVIEAPVARIAEFCGLSQRTAARSLNELEDAGRIVRRGGSLIEVVEA